MLALWRRAALTLLLLAAAMPARAAEPRANEAMETGKRVYREGEAAFRVGKFAEAAAKFESVYRLTHVPSVLFDWAQSLRRLAETSGDSAQLKQAIEAYKAYLHEAPPNAEKRALAQQLLNELTRRYNGLRSQLLASQMAQASGRDALALAARLAAEGDDRDAAAVLERVPATAGTPRDVVLAAYQQRGLVAARLDDSAAASDAFAHALALDAASALPGDAGAAARAAFAAARARLGGKPALRISQAPLGGLVAGQPPRLRVAVDADPLAMIDQVVVHYRAPGAPAYQPLAAPPGVIELPAELTRAARLEYYVVAVNRGGAELATLGAPERPFALAALAAVAAEPTATKPSRVPVYRRWWLWTTVGVVLAGAGVGLYFGLRPTTDCGKLGCVPTSSGLTGPGAATLGIGWR